MSRALQRKPRKGDLIGFGTFSAYPDVVEPVRPTHVVLRTPEGNPEHDGSADRLCWIQPIDRNGKPCGEANPFIWYHWHNGKPEGLNLLARIFDAGEEIVESMRLVEVEGAP